ncbi:unnamed protein product [Phyllotreta striolata]|uniref:superoxide dismutase n=1 Tax=Phyllotreta striolata TaxID=444603 RepID=A0A9N9XNP1_PHYSR|nr:unnamed protein product [Phyllotreta striolata]
MASTIIEFAVQLTCNSCVDTVKKTLSKVEGIEDVQVHLEEQRVVVKSKLPTLKLLKLLESTGKKVAVKGYAGGQAAVSILEAGDSNVKGVVRFIQPSSEVCIVDGTIDGLNAGSYRTYIYECGDISNGCNNVGQVFNPTGEPGTKNYGDIGLISSDEKNRSHFRFENNSLRVSDLIGRAFVVTKSNTEGTEKIACGVIARSAGLFQNPKTICACDGTTIWDEAGKKSTL